MSDHFFLINRNQVFFLNEGEEITIGRASNNQLVIADLRVSRVHARVKVMNGEVLIADLNSSGGTSVNGRPMVNKLLKPGDVVTLAGTFTMTYWYDRANLPLDTSPYKPAESLSKDQINTATLPDLDENK
jgi:pSer/pThr/pTyr-binding forkhead associated (FHA) protein